jgi:hypothetical protein
MGAAACWARVRVCSQGRISSSQAFTSDWRADDMAERTPSMRGLTCRPVRTRREGKDEGARTDLGGGVFAEGRAVRGIAAPALEGRDALVAVLLALLDDRKLGHL